MSRPLRLRTLLLLALLPPLLRRASALRSQYSTSWRLPPGSGDAAAAFRAGRRLASLAPEPAAGAALVAASDVAIMSPVGPHTITTVPSGTTGTVR